MPYLTPEDIPEDGTCRPLFIPASTDWLAFFGGALTELTKTYNWQEWGAVSVEDTVAKMQEIIDAWYAGECEECELPEGGRIIRLNEDGMIEILEDGEWIVPTDGDYYIPPPEAREGGDETEQICLAAANAENVLHELYENLAESFATPLSEAAALLALAGFATTRIGFAFAPITAGIAAFVLGFFGMLYTAISYLTADLWTEDFTEQIKCFLSECAVNDAGVVTFDWQCFNDKLATLADDFSLSEVQIRLYLQVAFMLQFIGGAGGLNLAGGTTEIEDADCPCICEVALQALDYGTVTHLGGTRWRIESTWTGSNYSALINAFGDCWCYSNIDYVSGSLTYSDYTVCIGGSPIVGMPNSCCESETVGMQDDLVNWFLQHLTVPFVIELDATCKTEC